MRVRSPFTCVLPLLPPAPRWQVSEEDLAALQRDDARIRAFFTKYTKMDKVSSNGRGESNV